MRRFLLPGTLALAATLAVGCADRSQSLLAPEASVQSRGQAGGVTTVQIGERLDFSPTIPNPCTGELVAFSGRLNVAWNMVFDRDGILIRETFHANPQGVSGVGQASGNAYRLVGSEDNTYQVFQTGAWQTMFVAKQRMISRGNEPNYHLFFQFFVKVDPDGTFNFHIFNPPSIECR